MRHHVSPEMPATGPESARGQWPDAARCALAQTTTCATVSSAPLRLPRGPFTLLGFFDIQCAPIPKPPPRSTREVHSPKHRDGGGPTCTGKPRAHLIKPTYS